MARAVFLTLIALASWKFEIAACSGDSGRKFLIAKFPGNLFARYNDDTASAVLDSLIDDFCVPKRFATPGVCDGATLFDIFSKQIFNFRNANDVKKYGAWLRLLNNLEFYKPHRPEELMKMLAVRNRQWALINGLVGRESQKHSAEVFRWTSDTWVRYHITNDYNKFMSTFYSFVNFFNTFVIWCNQEQAYYLKTIMYAYRNVRSTKYSYLHANTVDVVVADTIKLALNYPLSMMSPFAIKQLFYVFYINQCELDAKQIQFFNGYYVVVNKTFILPNVNRFDAGRAISYFVHHNVDDIDRIEAMRRETQFVYKNTIEFFDKIGVPFDDSTPTNISVYVHENKKMYESTGPLWIIPTNNGGYTHRHRKDRTIESHVYYESDLLPRNYGHELQHTLMYVLDRMNGMPTWFVEGVANRLGNRKCYDYDVNSLKNHLHTTNIKSIFKAEYGTDDAVLYGMGSALVQFLYETRPTEIGTMITTHNYTTIGTDYGNNAAIEHEFDVFKSNKLLECEKYKQQVGQQKNADDVGKKYAKAAADMTFPEKCKNFIGFEFDDVYYYMTPFRLIKSSRDANGANAQKQIRFNFDEISHYDYRWFLKGALKQTLKYFGDTQDLFNIDSIYSYRSRLFCGEALSLDDEDPRSAIAKFTFRSGIWSDLVFLENKTYEEGALYVKNYYVAASQCKTFINPPIDNAATAFSRLFAYTAKIKVLKDVKLSEEEKLVVVDARDNTLVHLMAIFNHKLYLINNAGAVRRIRNRDGHTPQQLYAYAVRYQQKFNKQPNTYCYTLIEKEKQQSNSTTYIKVNVTEYTSDENDIKTDGIVVGNGDVFKIILSFLWELVVKNKTIVISICIIVTVFIAIILLNVLITILIVKSKLKTVKRKCDNAGYVSYCKRNKEDECEIKLFKQ
ncbi:hypothetical protein Gyru_ORF128 [Gynaephora ruoergensis nucleopolyhedrovirus]|nr:hypothetical protein Gyru_ORF128 [Gynaephora ruoergensis nucleopolyhedrovirus]